MDQQAAEQLEKPAPQHAPEFRPREPDEATQGVVPVQVGDFMFIGTENFMNGVVKIMFGTLKFGKPETSGDFGGLKYSGIYVIRAADGIIIHHRFRCKRDDDEEMIFC